MAAQPEDSYALFVRAVTLVFERWTLLRLAVDQGWSDHHDGRVLAREMLEKTLAMFAPGKAAWEEEVEDLLLDYVELKFNAVAEDGSVEEVNDDRRFPSATSSSWKPEH
mmetsp:Transcript_1808/g.6444  ORF Transcript_1808/g.6444 Transcript_1808/m.6444 type:complete len:109 (-) Transcript_1808:371-697(-)